MPPIGWLLMVAVNVNPMFRCNRFEPGDANFHRHHDTPYYDAAREQISRYTVLLYLTGGSARPALDLGGLAALDTIDALTCVIFDQRYEHEGAPYQDGRKVFLRTELVFTEPGVRHDPAIAELFSKACTGNDGSGCLQLSFALGEGRGVPQNAAEAARFRRRACDLGIEVACTK